MALMPIVQVKAAKKQRMEEKKQEKNKKRRTKEIGDVESKKHKHKRRREEERSQKDKVGSDCFEKSSLTEERGHPAGSQNSTDNTLKSNKRQKLTSPPIIRRSSSGHIIWIKMPTQRQMGPEVLPIKEQQHSSPLGRTDDDASVRAMHETALIPGSEPCSTSGNTGSELTIRLSKSKLSPSAIVSQIPNLKDFAEPPSSLRASYPPTFTSDFIDLIADLIRPTLEGTDLQSWLFETKNDQNRKSINNKGSTGVNSAARQVISQLMLVATPVASQQLIIPVLNACVRQHLIPCRLCEVMSLEWEKITRVYPEIRRRILEKITQDQKAKIR